MKEKIGYKVVYSDKNYRKWGIIKTWENHHVTLYGSGCVVKIAAYSNFAVRYRIGRWTKPKPNCGPLVLFSMRRDAQHFLEHDTTEGCMDRELWECEYVPSRSRFRSMWFAVRNSMLYKANKRNWVPQGTVFASQLRITKKLEKRRL